MSDPGGAEIAVGGRRGAIRVVVAAAMVALAATGALADVTISSTLGFDGTSVEGTVTPLRIELASSEKTPITCMVQVRGSRGMAGAGAEGLVHEATVFLAPGAKKRITIPVIGRGWGGQEFLVDVRTDRRTLLRHGTDYVDGRAFPSFPAGSATGGGRFGGPNRIDPGLPVVGVLGDPNLRISWLASMSRDEEKRNLVTRSPWGGVLLHPPSAEPALAPGFISISPEAAPDLWLCYEGMDTVLWIDPDPDALKDAAQLEALLEWTACGGRLLVALTPGGRIAGASALAKALPAMPAGHDDVRAAEVLAMLVGSSSGAPAAPVPVARLETVRGKVLAKLPDGRPLLVTAPYGLGSVTAVSFDPRLLNGAGTKERAKLLRLLFGAVVASDPNSDAPQFGPGGTTLEPLLNHLRKRFLTAPPILLLVLGLLLYVVAIGPLDYLILKKKNRLRRTVVTFPVIVISFTLLAYGASFLLFGGSAGQVRVGWVDLATAPGRDADVLRGLDILGTYSPTGTTLPVAYEQPRSFADAPWMGTGGMAGVSDAGALDGVVEIGGDGRPALAVDVPLRSHRTVEGRFSGEVPIALDATVKKVGGHQVLQVRNGLPRRVRDLVVVWDRFGSGKARAHSVGDLERNGAIDVDLDAGTWVPPAETGVLPDPFHDGAGLFSGGGPEQFVPSDETEDENDRARTRMARAAMGASLGEAVAFGAPTRATRPLTRHGLDLSRQLREGRILVLGWCEGDPLGNLPVWRVARSTAVVVRRVVPAEGER